MPVPRTTAQARGRIGGYVRAATAPTRQSITQAARDARFEKYKAQVRQTRPEITDEAEIIRRAELLRKADMQALSLRAAVARTRAAEARRTAEQAEAELAEVDGGAA